MTPRVATHIRLSIRSVFPYLPIAKLLGVSLPNLAEFLRELRENHFFRAKGVLRRNAKKELFTWADLYTCRIFRTITEKTQY